MSKKRRRKPRRSRICKQRPVWTRGDVKDPGPLCKQCYHKHAWPERRAAAQRPRAAVIDNKLAPVPDAVPDDSWYWITDEDDDRILGARDPQYDDPEDKSCAGDEIPF